MQTYNVSRLPSMIKIGYDGENNWRPQAFDCTPLLQNHPNGTISLWLLPNGETQAFPVALTRDGNSVVWTPLSEEMTAATGALQLVCTDGTDVGKSAVVLFRVDESILPGANHPAAVPSWSTQTIERAESAAGRAEAAVSHYPQIRDGYWWVWDVQTETWVDTGVKATGEGGGTAADAVLYTAQSLTDAQKEQARENIGITYMTAADIDELWGDIDGIPNGDGVNY